MIFVDSSGWCAAFIKSDQDHEAARAWLRRNAAPLVTTDYIIDETLTALRVRKHVLFSILIGQKLLDGKFAKIERVTEEDFVHAWETFRNFKDKAWSFTDCTSRAVMVRLGIEQALAFDEHFRQFGNVTVVP